MGGRRGRTVAIDYSVRKGGAVGSLADSTLDLSQKAEK